MSLHHQLAIKAFHVNALTLADKFNYQNGNMTIVNKIDVTDECIDTASVSIIQPYQYSLFVNHIMDIIPISTKVLGQLGSGITHTLTGVYVLLTASDTQNEQFHNFGCSSGILNEKISFNQAGTPKESDYLIHINVTVKAGTTHSRNTVIAVHNCADYYIDHVRSMLKLIDLNNKHEKHVFKETPVSDKPRVVLIKQIGGQGAMHESILLPNDPSSSLGGICNTDIQSVPIMLTLNQYRDGAIRAMT